MSGEIFDLNDQTKEQTSNDESVALEVQNEVESDPTKPVTNEVSESEPDEDAILANQEESEEADKDDETKSEAESDSAKHRSRAAEKRIAKLVKEREALRGQLALFQQQMTQGYSQQEAYLPPAALDPSFPDPNKYPEGENDLDYKLDVREYQREQAKKDAEWKGKVKEAITKYPDLPELIEADEAKSNPTMVQLIKDSPVSVELFYHLMAHPEVSNKIADMSPAQSAREIGKIEARLEAEKESKAKTTTTAPVKKALPSPLSPVKPTKTAAIAKQADFSVY
jgi:hypothetical protein